MKLIDKNDIEYWSNMPSSIHDLPLLISRLIRATSINLKQLLIPKDKNIYRGGWDGIVISSDETEFIPEGISLWEFGTGSDYIQKANRDYKKRTSNPLGFRPGESTYVFVTSRYWENYNEWISEKKEEKIWKDIVVIDAAKLSEWLMVVPTQSYWLAEQIGKLPNDGIELPERFWRNYSKGPKYNLPPEAVTAGRQNEIEELLAFISKGPSLLSIITSSKDEVIAFIISSILQQEESYKEEILSRALIVENEKAFEIVKSNYKSLYLITKFLPSSTAYDAIERGHYVIIPKSILEGQNHFANFESILLTKLGREEFRNALLKIPSISDERSIKLSRESGRNITILRRQEGFEHNIPEWTKVENAEFLIPALLLGKWDESYEGDVTAIETLSNTTYDEYIKRVTKWLNISDPPLVKIGPKWSIISQLDCWTYISIGLTSGDLEKFSKLLIDILVEIDPASKIDDPKELFILSDRRRNHSDYLREGITQSLILIGVFGDRFKLPLNVPAQSWVDAIVRQLLAGKNYVAWRSLNDILPNIAEASPSQFLDNIERAIQDDSSLMSKVFNEIHSGFSPVGFHTGLLWGLESVAWIDEYLSRVVLTLASLENLDPGGKLANRPIKSLRSIFLPWIPQTTSTPEDRIGVLSLLLDKYPNVGFKLCLTILPKSHDTSWPTYRPRWRLFEMDLQRPITFTEMWSFHSSIVDLLCAKLTNDINLICDLLNLSDNLSPNDRDKVLKKITSLLPHIKKGKILIWNTLRIKLHHLRSSYNSKWALPKTEVDKLESLMEKVAPDNIIEKHLWMFDESWPYFPEGYNRASNSYDEQEEYIRNRRIDGLKEIITNYGFEHSISLIKKIKEPGIYGDTLAYILDGTDHFRFLVNLINSKSKKIEIAVKSFIFRKHILRGNEYIFEKYYMLKNENVSSSKLSRVLISLQPQRAVWELVAKQNKKIIDYYWFNFPTRFHFLTDEEKIFGLNKLIEYSRLSSATNIIYLYHEHFTNEIIFDGLKQIATGQNIEKEYINEGNIEFVLQQLDDKKDFDKSLMVELEWLYVPILAKYGSIRKPKLIYAELAKNPSLFIELLGYVYPSEDETPIKSESDKTPNEETNRSIVFYELLRNCNKIPGVEDNGEINYNQLSGWINKVRELGQEKKLLDHVDRFIGGLLAQYPEKGDLWPPNEICQIIERISTKEILQSFHAGTTNKRSFSSRSPYEGGDREHKLSIYFTEFGKKHAVKFPKVSSVLFNIAKQYEIEAKLEDERAAQTDLDD